MIKRALISVYDKTGIAEFAAFLLSRGVELISTGGTYHYLQQQGLAVTEVSEVTNFPELLDGRVKTLHPKIHAGILALRTNPQHLQALAAHSIEPIDLVVVNLYPFFSAVANEPNFKDKLEFIDIGGPTLLRAAAKAFKDVVVISEVSDYNLVQQQLAATDEVDLILRQRLASKVFNLTAAYDAAISQFLLGEELFPDYLNMSYRKRMDLRYGENSHQAAAFYTPTVGCGVLTDFKQLQGKELSFNNLRDMDLAWKVVSEFDQVAVCGVKHTTPCAVALANEVVTAYSKMYTSDPVSIFGGIVASNHEIDLATAYAMKQTFLEIIMAPSFTPQALAELHGKKNLRLIQVNTLKPSWPLEYVTVDGGILLQQTDQQLTSQFEVVSKTQPSATELADLQLGLKVVKHVKSNAIVVAKAGVVCGIGAGQTNRLWATQQAIERAGANGGVLASDAFFPFRDCIDVCAAAGIKAIVQPGGSIRDQEVIDACNQHQISLIFTGLRHFKH